MKKKTLANIVLGIAIEVAYALGVMLSAFLICLILSLESVF